MQEPKSLSLVKKLANVNMPVLLLALVKPIREEISFGDGQLI